MAMDKEMYSPKKYALENFLIVVLYERLYSNQWSSGNIVFYDDLAT
jgi:hypothetical protein